MGETHVESLSTHETSLGLESLSLSLSLFFSSRSKKKNVVVGEYRSAGRRCAQWRSRGGRLVMRELRRTVVKQSLPFLVSGAFGRSTGRCTVSPRARAQSSRFCRRAQTVMRVSFRERVVWNLRWRARWEGSRTNELVQ